MHLWLEWKIPESADANIDQAERWMIDRDVAAALRAIPTIANVAALEFAEKLCAFRQLHVLPFPQRECAHRRGGITSAIFAMTVTHLQGFPANLDLDRFAVTSTHMRLGHDSTFTARFAARRAKLTHAKSRDLRVVRPNLLKFALIDGANGAV